MSKHYFIFVLLCLALSGCGNGFIPVHGKVTFEDGSPLTQGGIAFSTATFMADGKIQADGSFTLTSSKPGDGLPPGNYTVTISASKTDDKERTIYLVDPKFGDVTTSPLTAEVSGNQKIFDFQVSKPK
ncbi:MAG: carboxypeptidase-like regulatory domain-containing protein [Planctomycetaceae bacterium]|jgi:hypothetical protein|nr:carboxypeptidase-like regulatory domain-containing protein [Planctomycetaceae bacterium]